MLEINLIMIRKLLLNVTKYYLIEIFLIYFLLICLYLIYKFDDLFLMLVKIFLLFEMNNVVLHPIYYILNDLRILMGKLYILCNLH